MEGSLLLQTLRLLSPGERDDLKEFLSCALFNGSRHAKQILALFTLLMQRIGLPEPENFKKAGLFNALYPGKPYRQGYFENLMSELLALVRRFVVHREVNLRWAEAFEYLTMARFYRQRGLPDRSAQTLHRMDTVLKNFAGEPDELPLLKFWLRHESAILESQNNQRKGDLELPATLEALTIFYGYHLLEMAAVLYQQQRVVPALHTDWRPLIENFRDLLRANDYFSQPVLLLLDKALLLSEASTDTPAEDLSGFLALLEQHEADLPVKVRKKLAAYARNFCIRHGARNNPVLKSIQLGLYKKHLEKGWLHEEGKLQPTTFINMINLGLKLGELSWVGEVLQIPSGQISGSNGDYLIHYGQASYYLHAGALESARESMKDFKQLPKLADIALEKLTRILEIKILYETSKKTGAVEIRLPDSLHSFVMFLRRSQRHLTDSQRAMDHNFIAIVRNMTCLIPGPAEPRPAKNSCKN